MKKLVSFMVILAFLVGGVAQAQSQSKAAERAERKQERKEKREAREVRDSIIDATEFNSALQAMKNQSFVLEAATVQAINGQVYSVNSTTNFVSLNDGRAMVQIASNSPFPGPNGLGGITVQGTASDIQMRQDNNGNVFMTMNVEGVFLSATINITLSSGGNLATVIVDPNFSGRYLTMSGTLLPYSQSLIFQGNSY